MQYLLKEAILNERKEYIFTEYYVVFVTDSSMIRTYPVSKYIKIPQLMDLHLYF